MRRVVGPWVNLCYIAEGWIDGWMDGGIDGSRDVKER